MPLDSSVEGAVERPKNLYKVPINIEKNTHEHLVTTELHRVP